MEKTAAILPASGVMVHVANVKAAGYQAIWEVSPNSDVIDGIAWPRISQSISRFPAELIVDYAEGDRCTVAMMVISRDIISEPRQTPATTAPSLSP